MISTSSPEDPYKHEIFLNVRLNETQSLCCSVRPPKTSVQPPASAMGMVHWKTSNIVPQILWRQKKWSGTDATQIDSRVLLSDLPKKKVDDIDHSSTFLIFYHFIQLLSTISQFFFKCSDFNTFATEIGAHMLSLTYFYSRTIPYRHRIQFPFNTVTTSQHLIT